MSNFNGKVIIVTGASSGIGADAAIEFAKKGATVAIVGRDAAKLNAVAKQIIDGGHNTPLEIVADVNKDAKRIINSTVEKFGKLDVLVNNAGIIEFGSSEVCTLDSFDRILNTNVRSVFELSQLAIPHLIATKGNIVNVSSICSQRAFSNALAYCTSKAALDQLTKCMALELAPKGIRVNAVNPGVIQTPIFKTLGMDDSAINRIAENSKSVYPVGRIGQVADTSLAIAYLAHESSSFITGQLLGVEGGIILACPPISFE